MPIDRHSKIGLLYGGLSRERDISLKTGAALAKGLRTKGYSVEEIDVGHDVASVLVAKNIQVAVIALHGNFGEDGTIQGVLEYLRIPYTGTGVFGSAVAMNKCASKRIFRDQSIPTPKWLEVSHDITEDKLHDLIQNHIGFPCIAKPDAEGSTLGLSKVKSFDEVAKAQKTALDHSDVVLWEQYIDGKELTVGFLEDNPLPIVEIVPHGGLFDYEAKYTKGKTDYYCPARISNEASKSAIDIAVKAYKSLNIMSFGRVDIIYDGHTPWVLEVNTIPGMTETSLLPKAALTKGIVFEDLAEKILMGSCLKMGGKDA
ncbi:MAG: D-alanine--D-alanine ligase [Bdellovibrionales bacterium]|nr:D-alanine--D-alanine ligase [Bdellovibrionales bacterium]